MRNSEPQSLNNLFNGFTLANIQTRSIALSRLNKMIYCYLPNHLHHCCRVANYRQSILIIEVCSAGWLTRLRYEQEKLLLALRQNGLSGLASIQYKINPVLNQPQSFVNDKVTTVGNKRTITPQSAPLLLALAQDATPKLKTNLIKLANHVLK